MLVAPVLQLRVRITNQRRTRIPEHNLQEDWLEAVVLVSVSHIRRTRNAIPRTQPFLDPIAVAIL
jgi:hypothetical protein